jgi:hypothetical protein
MASKITIQNGQFQRPDGSVVANGYLYLQLSSPAVVTSTGLVAPTQVVINLNSSGNAPATQIWGNDQLTPAGTTYQATLQDSNRSQVANFGAWSFTGAGPIELNTMQPTSVGASFPTPILASPGADQSIVSGNLLPASGNTTQSLGSGTAPWNAEFRALNNVVYADAFPGANMGAKIANAIAVLPATGGIVDARAFQGAQTFSSNPFAGIVGPVTLLTGNCTISWDATSFFVALPSDFSWIANGTILTSSVGDAPTFVSPDGICNGLINGKAAQTTANATNGNATITVANATQARVGGMVGVVGASGAGISGVNTGQNTTLNNGGNVAAGDTSFIVTSATGFISGTNAYVLIDNEIIGVTSIATNTFTVTRGQLGTTAASHTNGATVSAVPFLVAELTAVSGTSLTLSITPTFTVTGAACFIGPNNIRLDGDLTIDGNYHNRAVAASGNQGLSFLLASQVYVGPNVKLQFCGHGGVFLFASWYNNINGMYRHIGRPAAGLGADIWLFGQSNNNVVSSGQHEDGNYLCLIDDRSTAFSLMAGASNYNLVQLAAMAPQFTYTIGVGIEGYSSYNRVTLASAKVSSIGLQATSSGQWPNATPVPTGNTFQFQNINSSSVAIQTDTYGGGATSRNLFVGGVVVAGSISLVSTYDGAYALGSEGWTGLGTAQFFGNAYSWGMTRSAGNAGFPDLYGNGTNPLIIGGKSDGSGTVTFGTTTSVKVTKDLTVAGATPTGFGTDLGMGNTNGFGNGAAGTAVTTTLKNTGTGPTTPQTIVKYLQIDLGGTKYWLPLVQ